MMDLVLWRHAEAEDETAEVPDLDRALTSRGAKQAARVAAWLDRQLPESTRIYSSPARRTEQTVAALGRKYKLRPELAPGASVQQVLDVARWPSASGTVLVVGHQPTLGHVIAELVGLPEPELSVRKGAVWWLRCRERDGRQQAIVVAVQAPETV